VRVRDGALPHRPELSPQRSVAGPEEFGEIDELVSAPSHVA
jgi:hypothetical protein